MQTEISSVAPMSEKERLEREVFNQRIGEIRTAIKESVERVVDAKKQRRTVRYDGKRTWSPNVATSIASDCSKKLRCLYIVYGELRGKPVNETRPKTKPSELYLSEYRSKFIKGEATISQGSPE